MERADNDPRVREKVARRLYNVRRALKKLIVNALYVCVRRFRLRNRV